MITGTYSIFLLGLPFFIVIVMGVVVLVGHFVRKEKIKIRDARDSNEEK
jgi:hypothetical protein